MYFVNKANRKVNPVFEGIIPQDMLKAIAKNGTAKQREKALHNLSLSGFIRGQRSMMHPTGFGTVSAGQKRRTIYDTHNTTDLPGDLVRGETEPASSDVAVNEAFDGAGATYDLYMEVYGRNSIDDKGLRMDSTVHFDKGYDNAFWNGQQMTYGDGDGDLFEEGSFTNCIDVIGHELTHGVTQYEADLVYNDQPGALNESLSDVFGSLVKQRVLNQTADKADWLIGEGMFTSKVKGIALRSMKAPGTAYDDPVLGKDRQPDSMANYVNTSSDSGGVHTNSGIPNRAFYLAAVNIGGYAWEKAGKIWYVTLRDKLRPRSQFKDAALGTVQVAGDLFGVGGMEQKAVKDAWKDVGIQV
jgi:Zn-dependent metalloprotease